MLKSKLSRWLMRSVFTLAAVAAVSVLSAEQASAQYYGGGRGISVGSFGRSGGFNLSYGNRSSFGGYGYGGRGFSGYSRGGYNNYYRRSYGGGYGGGAYRGRGGFGSSYGRGGFRY